MFCPQCGTVPTPGGRFCGNCGLLPLVVSIAGATPNTGATRARVPLQSTACDARPRTQIDSAPALTLAVVACVVAFGLVFVAASAVGTRPRGRIDGARRNGRNAQRESSTGRHGRAPVGQRTHRPRRRR